MPFRFIFYLLLVLSLPRSLLAADPHCAPEDTACLVETLRVTANEIPQNNWRDSTYRELAKLMAQEKQFDDALAIITKITSPDTRAMTVRGIGMAAAELDISLEEKKTLFTKLRASADQIEHPPSYEIALTYIAMSQAFAGDNAGAFTTAQTMENPALRNKAFAESAEIQAERNNHEAARLSLGAIEDLAFKEKALRTVSKIFADKASFKQALEFAEEIENPYQKSQAILYILVRQVSPEEVSIQ